MNSTRYIVIFITILTAVAAVLLAGMREVTLSSALRNEDIFNKRSILSAVQEYLPGGKKAADLSDQEVLQIFDNQVEQVVLGADGKEKSDAGVMAEDIDMAKERKKPEAERNLPLFIYTEGGEKFYIMAVRGNGLWDEIWGYVALKGDFNTVAGATFDHKGETPGLGAEIKDNPSFPKQFEGKKIFEEGKYVSVTVRKGGARDQAHDVDAISGATITSNGVTEMLHRGIQYYLPYFKAQETQQGMLTK